MKGKETKGHERKGDTHHYTRKLPQKVGPFCLLPKSYEYSFSKNGRRWINHWNSASRITRTSTKRSPERGGFLTKMSMLEGSDAQNKCTIHDLSQSWHFCLWHLKSSKILILWDLWSGIGIIRIYDNHNMYNKFYLQYITWTCCSFTTESHDKRRLIPNGVKNFSCGVVMEAVITSIDVCSKATIFDFVAHTKHKHVWKCTEHFIVFHSSSSYLATRFIPIMAYSQSLLSTL